MHTGLRQAIVLALTLSALLIVLYMGFSRYSLEKYISKELVALRNECTLEKLSLLCDEDFWEICREIFKKHGAQGGEETLGGLYFADRGLFCCALQNHPEDPVGVQQILILHRKLKKLGAQKAFLLSPAPYQEEAGAMSRRLQTEIVLLGQEEFLQLEHPLIAPTQEELQKALAAKISRPTAESPKSRFLRKEKAKVYLLLGPLFAVLVCPYGLFHSIPACLGTLFFPLPILLDFREKAVCAAIGTTSIPPRLEQRGPGCSNPRAR